MAALPNSKIQYVGSVEWAAVPAYPGAGSVAAGTLCTNTANSPAVGSERVFVCTIGGVTLGTAPTFTNTKGALTEDAATTIYWQECTGQPGVNGDHANSPVWTANATVVLGQIIYDSGTASLQIAGSSFTAAATTPTFSATAGTTSTGQDVGKWTSLGLASAFGPWAAPHARVLNADAATWQTVVPAQIYISSDHAETKAATESLAGGQGTSTNPNQYLSVSNAVAPPTSITSGASINTTGANGIAFTGYGYYSGITFSAGSSSNTANIGMVTSNTSSGDAIYFEYCTFTLNNTSSSSVIQIAGAEAGAVEIEFNNPTFIFGSTSQTISIGGGVINSKGGTFALTGSAPSTAFTTNSTGFASGVVAFRDLDLSKITGTLYSLSNANSQTLYLENVKLGSGVTMTSGTNGVGACRFKLHNGDSSGTNYRFYETDNLGTIQQSTTTYDSTNEATNGTTPISWQIATSTTKTSFGQPYATEYLPIIEWQNTTSSVTATIQMSCASVLTNGDIWMEVEYMGSSGSPICSLATSRVTDALTAKSNYSTSTDTWTGGAGHNQYMSVTFTPAMVGPVKCRIYVAKASTTVYVNPLLQLGTVASARQFLMPGMGYLNEQANSGGGTPIMQSGIIQGLGAI